MKKIYLYHNGVSVDYFSTCKKLHQFLLSTNPSRTHKTFAVFKRWLEAKWIYEINVEGTEYCTIAKLN